MKGTGRLLGVELLELVLVGEDKRSSGEEPVKEELLLALALPEGLPVFELIVPLVVII